MLVTGDMHKKAEEVILKAFSAETLGVDILQVAHHGFNNVASLYRAVLAPIAIIPQSEWYMSYEKPGEDAEYTNKSKKEIMETLSEYADIYFAGDSSKTVGFSIRDGRISVIYSGRVV